MAFWCWGHILIILYYFILFYIILWCICSSASWTKRLKVSTQWMRSVMNAECHGYQYTHFKLYNKLCLQTMNRIVWCLKRVYTYHHANSRNRLDVRCERTMSFFTGYMTKHQKRHCCPRNNDEQTRVRQVSNREHGN